MTWYASTTDSRIGDTQRMNYSLSSIKLLQMQDDTLLRAKVSATKKTDAAEILGDPYHKLVPLPRIQSRAQGYTPSIPSKGIVDTPAVATAANAIQFLRRRRAGQCQRTLRTDAQRYMYLLNHFTPKILTN